MQPRAEDILWDEPRLESPHTQRDKAARVRGMFDRIAPTYELVNAVASMGRDARWRRQMVRLAAVRPDDALLDVACGTGDVARTFASAGIRPASIIGLDFSLPMLRLAKKGSGPFCAKHPSGRSGKRYLTPFSPHFCQGDAQLLPVASRSVSIVTCAFGVRNFQNLDAGLREMHRVLRSDGRAVILEFTVPTSFVFRRLYLFYLQRILPALATLISRDRTGAYRYLPCSVVSFPGRDAIISSLRAAGFSRVTVHPLSLGIVAVYVAHKTAPGCSAAS